METPELEWEVKRLKERNHLLERILKFAPDMVSCHDLEGRYLEVSPSCQTILGYSREEMLGRHAYEFFHPDDLEAVNESHKQALAGGKINMVQYRVLCENGRYKWLETTSHMTDEGQADAAMIVCYSRDVSQLRRDSRLMAWSQSMAKVGGWELDVASNQLILSEEVCHIHDLPPATQLDLERALSFYPPEAREIVENHLSRAVNERISFDFELPFVSQNGTRKYVRSMGTPFLEGDKVTQVLGTFQDITQRKQLEERILLSEQTARALLNATNEISLLSRTDGTIIDLNQVAARTIGKPVEEIINRHTKEMMPEAMWDLRFHQLEKMIQTRKPVEFSENYHNRNWETTLYPIIDEDGDILQFAINSRDHTQLKLSEEKFRTLADFTYDLETWRDPEGNYIWVSPSSMRITGYDKQEIMNRPNIMVEIVFEEDREMVENHFTQEMVSDRVVEMDFRIHHKDGSIRWVSHKCQPVYNNQGQFLGRRASDRDITERKRVEEALVVARDQAEAANRAKSRFLANMSHEIRSPLNSIMGFSKILMKQARDISLPEEFVQYLQNIQTSGSNLSELINNILDLSKIEAGKMTLSNEQINLRLLVQGIYHVNRAQALQKGVRFQYHFDSNHAECVVSDRTKLNQILMNLVSNAIKFTASGKAVDMRVFRENQRTVLQVKDEGIGISDEQRARIFQAFEQADDSTTRQYGGTGLGLTIVQRLTGLLGGTVSLESTPGQGSTFQVRLPLTMLDSVDQPQNTENWEDLRFGKDNLVLVVEDDETNQKMVRGLFKELGIKVQIAQDGIEAVEKVPEMLPDLVLMDIHMPQMDGLEATRLIRAKPGCADIPIIILSADAFHEKRKAAREAGATSYLTKPLDITKLMEVLTKYLKNVESIARDPKNMPPLPKVIQQQVAAEMEQLVKIPHFLTSRLINQLQHIKKMCEGYQSDYDELIPRLEEVIYDKAEQLPEVVREFLKK